MKSLLCAVFGFDYSSCWRFSSFSCSKNLLLLCFCESDYGQFWKSNEIFKIVWKLKAVLHFSFENFHFKLTLNISLSSHSSFWWWCWLNIIIYFWIIASFSHCSLFSFSLFLCVYFLLRICLVLVLPHSLWLFSSLSTRLNTLLYTKNNICISLTLKIVCRDFIFLTFFLSLLLHVHTQLHPHINCDLKVKREKFAFCIDQKMSWKRRVVEKKMSTTTTRDDDECWQEETTKNWFHFWLFFYLFYVFFSCQKPFFFLHNFQFIFILHRRCCWCLLISENEKSFLRLHWWSFSAVKMMIIMKENGSS